ncbi:hypothetical protein ACOMHN_009392 [Nucella lapillus]
MTPTVSASSHTSESSESGSSQRLTKPIGKLLRKLSSIDGEDEIPGSSALERKDSKPFIVKLLSTKKTGQDANDPDSLQSGSSQETEEKSCLIIRMLPNTKLSRFADAHLSHKSSIASQHSLPSSSRDQAVQEEPEVTERPEVTEWSTSQTSAEDKVTAQSKDSPLLGYWKLEANENWDTFLKEAGVGVLLRKIGCEITTFEDISTTGDQWHIRILSSLRNFEHCFRLDEEFEEENFDGYRVKAIAWLEEDGRKLTMEQTALESEGLELHIVRELMSDDTLLLTVTSLKSGITAKRHFVRMPQDQMP